MIFKSRNNFNLNFEFVERYTVGCDGSIDKNSCCTTTNRCGINEGDCDNDEDCHGNLICGNDNCISATGTLLWAAG